MPKSTTELSKPLQPLDDWERMYGSAEDSVQPSSWRFTALWSSLPSYMPLRLGLSTADMRKSSTTFTPVVFVDSYGSSGRIKFRTQTSCGEPAIRASTPSCRKPRACGADVDYQTAILWRTFRGKTLDKRSEKKTQGVLKLDYRLIHSVSKSSHLLTTCDFVTS